MKILCIGDSLGLPRKGCNYEDTWVALLRNKYPKHTFIDHFHGDRLIDSALSDYNHYYKYCNPDIVIIQQGICDCAPRYINDDKFSVRVIRKMFYLLRMENLFWRLVKKHKRSPDCVYTHPEKFVNTYKMLIDSILDGVERCVILVKIGHGDKTITAASPYFNKNADRYNNLIDQIASGYSKVYVIDPLNDVKDEMFVDGYHCGPLGMQKVSASLCSVFDKLLL